MLSIVFTATMPKDKFFCSHLTQITLEEQIYAYQDIYLFFADCNEQLGFYKQKKTTMYVVF